MENSGQKCSGNCKNCNPYQRGFCASQLAYNNMMQLDLLTKELIHIKEKIDAMQSNEASIFNPNDEDFVPLSRSNETIRKTAQEEGGAENRP